MVNLQLIKKIKFGQFRKQMAILERASRSLERWAEWAEHGKLMPNGIKHRVIIYKYSKASIYTVKIEYIYTVIRLYGYTVIRLYGYTLIRLYGYTVIRYNYLNALMVSL
jgi:hypothetical protein